MSIAKFSFLNAAYATIAPYLLPIIAVVVGLFLILSLTTSYVYTGDTIQDRFESMIDIFSNFFGTIIDTVKNGFDNIIDAIKGLIPSIDDIWNNIKDRVTALIPDLSGIYEYIDGKYQDAKDLISANLTGVYDYIDDKYEDLKDIVTLRISDLRSSIDDMIHDYVIEDIFEPMFNWVDYDWDHSKWIPWNLYYGIKQTVIHFVEQIPAIDWLNDNYDKLRDLV